MRHATRSIRFLRSATAAALAALAATAAPAAAQPFAPVSAVDGLGLPSVVHIGQTITPVGATPVLTAFTFFLGDAYNGANLRFDASVFEYAAGSVVGPALSTLTGVAGSANLVGLDPFVFDIPDVALDPTRTYALLLSATAVADGDPAGARNLVGTTEDPATGLGDVYAGGTFVFGDERTALLELGFDAAFDAAFDARFSPIPEPATVALVAGGLVALAGTARRRTRPGSRR